MMIIIFSFGEATAKSKQNIRISELTIEQSLECIATVFQTGNHLEISLVEFVQSVKQIKVAWLIELIKLY